VVGPAGELRRESAEWQAERVAMALLPPRSTANPRSRY
jgi:hypothetical protein